LKLMQSRGKTNADCLQSGKSNVFQAGSTIRRNHAAKSEQVRTTNYNLSVFVNLSHGIIFLI
jgi:hypothetical protein